MIKRLRILFIIFLCLLISERSSFADHSSDIVDGGKKPLTQKIINYSNPEGLTYPKIKSDKELRNKYCTKAKYIEAEKFEEDGKPIFEENNSINLKIKFFHFEKKYHPTIKFENFIEVVKKK